MYTLLIAVDGSEGSRRAVDHVVRLAAAGLPVAVHVLNVQIPVESGHVRMFIEAERIEGYYREEGLAALDPACAVLAGAGLAPSRHLAVGHVTETILHYAEKLRADQIVLGSNDDASLRHRLLGSVASDVAARASVPVTLVR